MYYDEGASKVLSRFKINKASGHTAKSAAEFSQKFGKNEIAKKKPKGLFKRIGEALLEPMVIILLFGWAVTFGVNIGKQFFGGGGNFYECLGILIAVAVSVSLTVIMEGRSQKAFELLSGLKKTASVHVLRGGAAVLIPQNKLAVGDVVILEVGDKIFADGRLFESDDLRTDEAMLTGESADVKKNAEAVLIEKTPLAERVNMVYSGTFVSFGSGKYVVTAVGDHAEIGKLSLSLNSKNEISAPLKQKLTKLGTLVSIMGAAALFVFLLSLARLIALEEASFINVQNIFVEAIVLIIAAVPEGLPATVAISLSLNVLRLAKSNALIKKLIAAETVGSVSVICTDKTGTLTQNKMLVNKVIFSNKSFAENGLSKNLLTINAAVNSTAELKSDGEIGSKTEIALLAALKKSGISYEKLRKEVEITDRLPFSSENKYMSTTVTLDGKVFTFLKGAPEIIASLTENASGYADGIKKEQKKAARVIAFGHIDENGKYFDGYAVIEDRIREDVYRAVTLAKGAGVQVKILTGDNAETAAAVAAAVGLTNIKVVSGDYLDGLSDEELSREIQSVSVVARSTPEIKLRVVRTLQSLGEIVAVTGDGVNDAPAIRHADIGIAMGGGSDITKDAADVILLDNAFSTIIKAIAFGRNIFKNFQRFITFQLTVNLSSMAIIIANLLMGLDSPFSSTCLLWLNLIMDGPLALSLALEKNSGDALERAPVKRNESILSVRIVTRIVLHALYTCLFVALQENFNFLDCELTEQKTVVFAMFVVFQLFNAINCREVRTGSALKGFTSNKLLLIMLGATFAVQIFITSFVPQFFSTVPLSALSWIKITALCSTIVLFSELYKLAYRVICFKKRGVFFKKIKINN